MPLCPLAPPLPLPADAPPLPPFSVELAPAMPLLPAEPAEPGVAPPALGAPPLLAAEPPDAVAPPPVGTCAPLSELEHPLSAIAVKNSPIAELLTRTVMTTLLSKHPVTFGESSKADCSQIRRARAVQENCAESGLSRALLGAPLKIGHISIGASFSPS
jgi:hypothetical protein